MVNKAYVNRNLHCLGGEKKKNNEKTHFKSIYLGKRVQFTLYTLQDGYIKSSYYLLQVYLNAFYLVCIESSYLHSVISINIHGT